VSRAEFGVVVPFIWKLFVVFVFVFENRGQNDFCGKRLAKKILSPHGVAVPSRGAEA
jgi:hypothetical protein